MKERKSNGTFNEYYESVSQRCGILQVILYLSLLLFVVVSLLSNTGLITYRNLYYFFTDLTASAENVDLLWSDTVSYPADTDRSYTLYRQGLAIAGNNSVLAFTSSGRQTLSENRQFQNPVAIGSGKYLLVYELGGTGYAVYNSYTLLESGNAKNPIRAATVSDSGSYAFVFSDSEYASVAEVYSRNFALINRYSYNSYVTDLALNANGTVLAVLCAEPNGENFAGTLHLYEPGTEKELAKTDLPGGYGMKCGFSSNGILGVISSDSVCFFTQKGKLVGTQTLDGGEILCASLTENGVALLVRAEGFSGVNRLLWFDSDGKLIFSDETEDNAEAVSVTKSTLYVMLSDGVLRVNASTQKTDRMDCSTEDTVLLALDSSRFYLCSRKKAVCYRF